MGLKIVYWATTALASLALLGSLMYLTGSEEVVTGFVKAGYPQHLRIVLGIAKPLAAIIILLPGLALIKEWAHAGAGITWVMATIAHYSSGEGPGVWAVPLTLLVLLIVSYLTRPASRRLALGRSALAM
jgi:DoxX-like family